MLIYHYVCYCCRPGSIRADAFRGHGLSLLEKTTLRGLRTRAIPAGQGRLRQLLHRTKKIGLYFRGDTALLSPGRVKLLYRKVHQLMKSVLSKHYTSNPHTRRLLREERPRWDPAVR